eukprot:scaffold56706_cov54-Attheya_sp.AAC.4
MAWGASSVSNKRRLVPRNIKQTAHSCGCALVWSLSQTPRPHSFPHANDSVGKAANNWPMCTDVPFQHTKCTFNKDNDDDSDDDDDSSSAGLISITTVARSRMTNR